MIHTINYFLINTKNNNRYITKILTKIFEQDMKLFSLSHVPYGGKKRGLAPQALLDVNVCPLFPVTIKYVPYIVISLNLLAIYKFLLISLVLRELYSFFVSFFFFTQTK